MKSLEERFNADIEEQIQFLKEAVISGRLDHTEYASKCGVISGLSLASSIFNAHMQKMQESGYDF